MTMTEKDEKEMIRKVIREEFYRGKYATANEKRYLALLTKNILETELDVVYERIAKDFLSPDGLNKTHIRTLPKSYNGFAPNAWVAGMFGMNEGNEVLRVINEETGAEGKFNLRTKGIEGNPKDMVKISCDDHELNTMMQAVIYQTNMDYDKAMERDKRNPRPSRLTPDEKKHVVNLINSIREEGFRFKQIYGGTIHTRNSHERDDLSAEEIVDKCGRSLDVDTFIVVDPATLRGGFFTINGHDGLGKSDRVIESFKCDPEYQEDFENFIEKATGVERETFRQPPKSVLDTPTFG